MIKYIRLTELGLKVIHAVTPQMRNQFIGEGF